MFKGKMSHYLEFNKSAGGLFTSKYTTTLYIYLHIDTCREVQRCACKHTHARRERKSLLDTLQGSTWDKIQLHCIQSIYQSKNTNPYTCIHTRTAALRGVLWSEGALVSVVIYQNMRFKVPWQVKPVVAACVNFFSSLWTLQHIIPHRCALVM